MRHHGDVLHLLAELHVAGARKARLAGCLPQHRVRLLQRVGGLAMLGLDQAKPGLRLQQLAIVLLDRDLARFVLGGRLRGLALGDCLCGRQLLDRGFVGDRGAVERLRTLLAAIQLLRNAAQGALGTLAIARQDQRDRQRHLNRSPSYH